MRPVYLEEKIWHPMGAEADATWLIDRSGQEATFCCLNAVLRDYARLGLLLAGGGSRGGRPKSGLVMVHTAVRRQPSGDPGSRESVALWQAAVRALSG